MTTENQAIEMNRYSLLADDANAEENKSIDFIISLSDPTASGISTDDIEKAFPEMWAAAKYKQMELMVAEITKKFRDDGKPFIDAKTLAVSVARKHFEQDTGWRLLVADRVVKAARSVLAN